MKNRVYVLIYICSLMILGQASAGTAEITGGWNVAGNGQQADSGVSHLTFSGSDPSITLGISADSSLYGPGSDSRTWTGSQNIDINIAGFRLSAGYDGKVDSNVILTSVGSASAAAFVGASASGLATGHVPTGTGTGGDSYDMFGSSDITTEGFVSGQGTAAASASGSANYDSRNLE